MILKKYKLFILCLTTLVFTNCAVVGKRYFNSVNKIGFVSDTIIYKNNKGYFYSDGWVEVCKIKNGQKHGRTVMIYNYYGDTFSRIVICKYKYGVQHGVARYYDKDWKKVGKNFFTNGKAKYVGGVSF